MKWKFTISISKSMAEENSSYFVKIHLHLEQYASTWKWKFSISKPTLRRERRYSKKLSLFFLMVEMKILSSFFSRCKNSRSVWSRSRKKSVTRENETGWSTPAKSHRHRRVSRIIIKARMIEHVPRNNRDVCRGCPIETSGSFRLWSPASRSVGSI